LKGGWAIFPEKIFLYSKNCRKKIVQGEPWGDIEKVLRTDQVLCLTLKRILAQATVHRKKIMHNLMVRKTFSHEWVETL